MRSAVAAVITLVTLLSLSGCASQPIALDGAGIAAASPASCPRSAVVLRVLGDNDDVRRWYLEQLTQRNVTIDPSARTTLQIEVPVVEDRGNEACLVLRARFVLDGQDFSAHVVEATRCYRGTSDKGARAFLDLAALAAALAGMRPEFPHNPEDAPVEAMRTELVERIERACR